MRDVSLCLLIACAAAAVVRPSAAAPRSPPEGVPALQGPAAAEDTIRLVDDAGREVVLDGPARRIVSLVPALTEVLFAIGAGDRLVGRTRFDAHPPAVRRVPSVGDGIRPSIEVVLAREPDLVLLYAGPDNRGVAEELRRVGLRTLALRHDRLEDLERNVERLGEATACREGARALTEALRRDLQAVAEAAAEVPARSVYYDLWPDPPITVGAGSYLDSLIVQAGGRNVFAELAAPSPQVSLEAIAARDPDVIVWPVSREGPARPPPAARPGWLAVAAVRRGDVRRVDGELVHRLGPRIGEAAAALAGAIHPELSERLLPVSRSEVRATACGGRPGSRGRRERRWRAGP